MKKRCVREREDDYRNTIMPGGQDPALLMIRCSVCICARRREDDNSVLIALVRETYEVIFVVLATCVPSPHCLVPPTCALIFICVSLSLSVSWQFLIHLHFATVSPADHSYRPSRDRRREERWLSSEESSTILFIVLSSSIKSGRVEERRTEEREREIKKTPTPKGDREGKVRR